MAKRIIVLSDGTWETVGSGEVWTITDDAYDDLLDGISEPKHLTAGDVLDTKEIE